MSNQKTKSKKAIRRLPAGNTRPEVTSRLSSGQVSKIAHGMSHGYIRTKDDRKVYFHRSDTEEDLFNQLEVGTAVTFGLIEDRLSGARAIQVRRPHQKTVGAKE